MSKESFPSDRDIDGGPDRESAAGHRHGDSKQDSTVDRDGDTVAATSLVFGTGSAPDSADPRIEPSEREALEAADLDPDAVANKECSYRMLLDEGIDEPLADDLRRRFSLPWSFETDGDLDRRSAAVRGLGDAEREWVAVSADGEWQGFEAAGARTDAAAADAEPEDDERPYPRPTPVTAVTGVGPDDASRLAEGGIRSAERLATVRANEVAKALDLNVLHVRTWRHNARELRSG